MNWLRSRSSVFARAMKQNQVGIDETSAPNRLRADSEQVEDRHGRAPTPAGRRKHFRPIDHVDAPTQAAALLRLIQDWDHDYDDGRTLDHDRLSAIYRQMCVQNHWRQRDWGRIGRHFDLLTTNGRKPYATFFDDDGRPRRRRVYPIPKK